MKLKNCEEINPSGKCFKRKSPLSKKKTPSPKRKSQFIKKKTSSPKRKSLQCPQGQERNPDTGRCRKKCTSEQERNSSGKCVKRKTPTTPSIKTPTPSIKTPTPSIKSPTNNIIQKWKVQKQIGESGKEGTCYIVNNIITSENYAMKQFKPMKSKAKFDIEVLFQRRAGILGLAPKVVDVMYDPPRIVMEIMNRTIEQVIKDQNGILTEDQQNDIISLCEKLDENNIYHCDPNPLNLMEGIDGKFKWIDYGMSIDINVKKHTNPNLKSLKTVFYGGMQGLISRKICKKNNIKKINEKISLYYTI